VKAIGRKVVRAVQSTIPSSNLQQSSIAAVDIAWLSEAGIRLELESARVARQFLTLVGKKGQPPMMCNISLSKNIGRAAVSPNFITTALQLMRIIDM
jgi:hypothetical protein